MLKIREYKTRCRVSCYGGKKMVEEKRLGSTSKPVLDHGTHTLSSLMFPQGRPASGSWNIQEEIRRVRSKATEELLRSLPSTRIDWSASALEKRSVLGSLPGGQREDDVGDKLHIVKMPRFEFELNSSSALSVSEKAEYGLQKEDLPLPDSDAASMDGKGTQNALEEMFSSGQRLEASEYIKTAPRSIVVLAYNIQIPLSVTVMLVVVILMDIRTQVGLNNKIQWSEEPYKFQIQNYTCNMLDDRSGCSRSAYTANGFPSSVAGKHLSAKLNTAENSVLNGESNPVSSSHEMLYVEVHELIENYIDVTKDNDFVASGSQNSYSMPDDLSQELTQPSPVAKTDTVVEKQKGKRLTRYNRRGRSGANNTELWLLYLTV
ncbi:hypothetical protein D8674_015060 [Pyrus ussuriensis x Pyrus communis]|uniref:Uncharacterized protein n=1 Tax=Pyrus ussuriensis x Pyrus communis TaxID=2448454 RepID=A0A5N5GZ70_9ROSA|nr:hypothetical protein D8674_015060 [Pyrus ussuriensis x Pyrus communis]